MKDAPLTLLARGYHYLQSFSESFRLALGLWPIIAAVATIPILLFEYLKFRRISFWRVVMWYGFVLYLLGLLALTLYPLPDNPARFCAEFQAATITQKVPLESIAGALESRSAFVQVVMNIAFFVPLGLFLRYIFGFKWYTAILLSFGVLDNWIGVDLAKNPDQLAEFVTSFPLPVEVT